jgi:large subunit ribosomal protein L17
MRHQKAGRKLSRTASHRKALLRNMLASMFAHEKIETTTPKAKELRPLAEKMITLGKRGDLHARRQVLRLIPDRKVVHKLFEEIAPRYENRHGGYTRIVRTGYRAGDNAPLSIIELVREDVKAKKKKAKKKKVTSKAKPEQNKKQAEAVPETEAKAESSTEATEPAAATDEESSKNAEGQDVAEATRDEPEAENKSGALPEEGAEDEATEKKTEAEGESK